MSLSFALLMGLVAMNPAVANAGFEKAGDQTAAPADWSFTSLPNRSHLVRYETKVDPAGTDSRALSITVAPDHPEQQVAYNAHQDVPGIVAGKKYRIAAKVQARGLQTLPMVVVQCLDQTGSKALAISRTPERELTGDVEQWEAVQTEMQVPEGTTTFRLRVGIPAAGNAGGTALIDDIIIVEIPHDSE